MAYTSSLSSFNTGYCQAYNQSALLNLQAWTWAFWAKRTGTLVYNSSIVSNGLANGTDGCRDLNLSTLNKLSVYVKTNTGAADFGAATTTMSTDWQFYVMSFDFTRTPQVYLWQTGYPTSGVLSAITFNTALPGNGTLGNEPYPIQLWMQRTSGDRAINTVDLGPFADWNRALTLAEAQQVALGGPLAQPSGLVAWNQHDYGTLPAGNTAKIDHRGINWTYYNNSSGLVPKPGPPMLWMPWRRRRNTYTPSLGSVYTDTLAFAASGGLAGAGPLSMGPALTFGVSGALSDAGPLTLDHALALGASAAVSDAGTASMAATLAHAIAAGLGASGGSAFAESLLLGASGGLAPAGLVGWSPSLSLAMSAAHSASALETHQAALAFASAAGLSTSAAAAFADALTFAGSSGLSPAGTAAFSESVALGESSGFATSGTVDSLLVSSITAGASAGLTPSASLHAAAVAALGTSVGLPVGVAASLAAQLALAGAAGITNATIAQLASAFSLAMQAGLISLDGAGAQIAALVGTIRAWARVSGRIDARPAVDGDVDAHARVSGSVVTREGD